MGGVAQQAIELILARQLASGLAVPVLLVDAPGHRTNSLEDELGLEQGMRHIVAAMAAMGSAA